MRLVILALLLAALPAGAADFTFAASVDGKFQLVPNTKDADGDVVDAAFYSKCDVGVAWGAGQTAAVTITNPSPGVAVLVSFPAAKGAGTGSATCTNSDGTTGAAATAAITFRRGTPAKPALSK